MAVLVEPHRDAEKTTNMARDIPTTWGFPCLDRKYGVLSPQRVSERGVATVVSQVEPYFSAAF